MQTRRQLLRTLPLAAGALAACDLSEPAPRYRLPKRPLEVVTSTVQAADLIRRVGSEAVNVRSLIPPQINPHLWQPLAADLAAIQLADVFFLSGLGLESRFTLDLEKLRQQGLFVGVLANGLLDEDILLRPDGKPDPHFWMDPRLWAKAAQEAATVLSAAAPPAKVWFSDRSHEYVTDLEKFQVDTARTLAEIPPRSRFLLSSHDTMLYFGKAYGMEVRSLATAGGEAPPEASAELVAWLGEHNVRSLFREQLADLETIRRLARPLMLNSDAMVFSLSLALPGTRFPGISSELAVDSYLPAMRYTIEGVLGRIAID
jgi:manganese/zinc/iron transport system substrate-binding protein